MINYLWIDVETTGLDSNLNDVVQLACIPIIDGKEQETFDAYCQPVDWNHIAKEALDINHLTIEQLHTFQSPAAMLDKLISYLKAFKTKFTIAGYNSTFDRKFVSSLFTKHNRASEFVNLFTSDLHDTYKRAQSVKSKIGSHNLKLPTLAATFNIPIQAHNAISDIRATVQIDQIIGDMLGESKVEIEAHIEDVCNIEFKEPAQLHLHSIYGMVDSIPTIDEWVEWCKKTNTPGFSIVDHGVATSIYEVVKNKEIVGIPGAGLFFTLDNKEYHAFNAWAICEKGYFNLMKLASLGYTRAVDHEGISIPILTVDEINRYREGLKFGTSDLRSAMGKAVSAGSREHAEACFKSYVSIFGDNLYVEFNPVDMMYKFTSKIGFQPISKNEMVPDGNLQKAYNRFLAEMVDEFELPAVPVSGADFIDPDDKLIQDCISQNSYKNNQYCHESRHAKTAKELFTGLKKHLGKWLTEDKFRTWIDNTHQFVTWAKDIDIKFDFHLPQIDIPEHIRQKTDDYKMQTYYYTWERIKVHGRWNDDPAYVARFKRELDVVMNNETLNFLPYFLIYEDLGTFARENGILQSIARGSAGGSLLSYYLKIIHIDPIKADLPFERFLSHARIRAGSFPDIDMDIGDTARPLIMKYLQGKYNLGFAQISTFQTMKTKNAIKDVMYALYGKIRNDPEVMTVCNTIPDSPQGYSEMDFLYGFTDKEGETHVGHLAENEILQNFFKKYPDVEKICLKMIGLIRGWSRHASAFIISTLDLAHQRVPTTVMMDEDIGSVLVTQYDADLVQECGLPKADILGLKTLTIVSDCIKLVHENASKNYLEEDERGMALIYRLPEDSAIYGDFYHKETDSSFQFNTDFVKGYIQDFVPTERKHLAVITSLCRPGAVDAEWEKGVSAAQHYINVRKGTSPMTFVHEDLRPILSDSNGIYCYQEEVMKFLVDIAGYTLEESDQIRGAIAKKKHEVMMSTFDRIREATKKRGWTLEQADKVCNHIQAFSRYSFNKSHAYAYAELGYVTMYLKHHHPLEWWTSVLNNSIHEEDKLRKFVMLLGNIVQPPSLKTVTSRFAIDNGKIRAPLSVVKGVGGAAVEELKSKAPFTSLEDYLERVDQRKVHIGAMSALIRSRAADCFMDYGMLYPDARKKLMDDYRRIRTSKSEFKDDMYKLDAISIFLAEQESNTCFNKTLLTDPSILKALQGRWSGLKITGKRGIPLMLGETPILEGIQVAQGFVKNNYDKEVGMILLYDSSAVRSGVAKKSGKPWQLTSLRLSDGYFMSEAILWDHDKPLRWHKNSIVYVRGTLKAGWRHLISITVAEIEKIEEENLK